MKRILALIAVMSLSACTDPEGAIRTLDAHGFKDIHMTGYRWTGCGRNDAYHTGFSATALNGRRVTGVVCSGWGWGKAFTVRLD